MKKYIMIILTSIIIINLNFCSNENITINKIIKITGKDKVDGKYIIVPQTGCGGCISEIESFIINHYSEYNIIYTFIKSKKEIIIFYKINGVNTENFYFDTNNYLFNEKDENSVYPLQFEILDNRIKNKTYIK